MSSASSYWYASFQPAVKIYLYLLISSGFLTSCSDNRKKLVAYAEMDNGFTTASIVIENGNYELLATLQGRLYKPEAEEKALIWTPKAIHVSKLSDCMYSYIDSMKSAIEKQANIVRRKDASINIDSCHPTNETMPNAYNLVQHLLKQLQQYNDSIVTIDTGFTSQVGFSTGITTQVENYLHQATELESLTLLSKIQSQIRINEHELLRYCKINSSYNDDSFDVSVPTVTQDYKYIKVGDEITISAGICSYKHPLHTSITINGNKGLDQVEGDVLFKYKAASQPGKHTIPVRMQFVLPWGESVDTTRMLTYYTLEN